jgi:hypothetical protein
MFCSPARQTVGGKDKTSNTCMNLEELKTLANDFNKNSKTKIKMSVNKRLIVKQFKEKLGSTCGKEEHCWIQQDFVSPQTKAKILNKAFRPLKPKEWYKNRQTWLNTYDIQKVIKQYEEKYKDFWFIGVFPIDFAEKDEYGYCVSPDMCSFDVAKVLERKKKRFGMVLNLDRHDQSGSHWVSVYCGLDPKKPNFGIYYYDSVAYPPPKQVASFLRLIEKQVVGLYGNEVGKRFAMRYNRIQKQFDNYDCGMFSEVFITQILKRIPFDDICKRMRTDRDINMLRDVLYTPSHVPTAKSAQK